MIVLGTNRVLKAMKPEPASAMRGWLDVQAAETLCPSSVTTTELLFGIGALPDGRHKPKPATIPGGLLGLCDGRTLPFDTEAAHHHTGLTVAARKAGGDLKMPIQAVPTPDFGCIFR